MNSLDGPIFQCTAGKGEQEEGVREVSVEAILDEEAWRRGVHPPGILYRYQNKGVTKLDCCKGNNILDTQDGGLRCLE